MNAAIPLVTAQAALSCLALGPWGAILSPGQEYGGLYSPPFGPYVDSPSKPGYSDAAGAACPLPEVPATSNSHEDTLTAWHLQRLTHLSRSESFDKLSMIAFETIPVLTEVSAIRRALALFDATRPAPPKPVYVSFVFPRDEASGELRFPDAQHKGKTLAEQAKLIVAAVFEERAGQATIGGLGVNCTSPVLVHSVVAELSAALRVQAVSEDKKPTFVLYCDGGSVYDVVTRTWSNPHGMDEVQWAATVADVVGQALETNVWGGVIAGGCCKAGPHSISELRKEVERRGWTPTRK